MNFAHHPIFQAGRNQPTNTLNSNWNSHASRRLISGTSTGHGISNTLTDGWLSTSLVMCSDCHGNDDTAATAPRGPHGSAKKWILRGADVNVKVTIADGTVTSPNSSPALTTGAEGNYCLNCHRRDVYGDGESGGTTGNMDHSRLSHMGDWNASCQDLANLGAAFAGTSGCYNCHGGRKDQNSFGNPANTVVQSGAIHGTSMTYKAGDGSGYASPETRWATAS